MRRSFARLVVSSVLGFWAVGCTIIWLHARAQIWTAEAAKRDGVFLVHKTLSQLPEEGRFSHLEELSPNFSVEFTLMGVGEVERRTGQRLLPGQHLQHKESMAEQWHFLAFEDGQRVLAAGPVNPSLPEGAFPMGALLMVVLLPLLAGLVVLRVERGLTKVERASRALAVGDLSARVEAANGPPDELAANFNAMADRVEELIRSRDELVQAVSHELGAPLSRLRFHMELLPSQSERKRGERLNAMIRDLDALDELVKELLSYVQSDDAELHRKVFDPEQGLTDLAELARLEDAEDQTVIVDVDISGTTDVFADPRLFLRAVENTLRNAVRHARNRVLLRVTQESDSVIVAVHDDGPGIPESLRDKVTLPFFRPEPDRDRKTGGVGLGLAIVSRIMSRHGGGLEIDDSRLGGAAVVMRWPPKDSN